MKHLFIFQMCLLSLCTFGCSNKQQSETPEKPDHLAQYRDTLIGNFSGQGIDTLICEPMDSLTEFHYKWRVFTKNNTVKPLIIDNMTISIHFVYEGDLDGNGTDEWGYVTEWETSNWMGYNAFTCVNGQWQHIIEPTRIWLPHLYIIKKEDILQSYDKNGFLKVKFSDVRNDGEDFMIIDTLIQINPQRLDGFE